MSRLKHGISIFALFIALVSVAVLPLIFAQYKNKQRLNRVTVQELPQQSTQEPQIIKKQSTFEKIKAIRDAGVVVQMNGKRETGSAIVESEEYIIREMEEEVRKLRTFNVLQELNMENSKGASIKEISYRDGSTSLLNVWVIYVEYPDFYIQTYMDTETHLLYDITLTGISNIFTYEDPETKKGFLEYLGIDYDEKSKQGEIFHVGSYSENKIRLFISVYNEKTKINTSYNFNDFNPSSYEAIEAEDEQDIIYNYDTFPKQNRSTYFVE